MKKLLKSLALPDFLMQDGRCIKTQHEWEEKRKEIKNLLQKEEYGYFPPAVPVSVKTETKREKEFSGFSVWESLSFTFFNRGKSHTLPVQLIYPDNKGEEIPFIVYINFSPDIPDKYIYIEDITEQGFGVAVFCYKDVTSDSENWDGLAQVLCPPEEKTGETFGKLVLWAYAAQCVAAHLKTLPFVDSENIAVMGHSRLGKTAMLAAAFDESFKYACINDSGCCGAAISRGKGGENISQITERFPFWFCGNFKKYAGREDQMPFDQHFLMALIAPRRVCIGTAELDTWADTKYQLLTCIAADKAYKLYGKDGFIYNNEPPAAPTKLLDGDIAFFCRSGTHFMSIRDWRIYMTYIKRFMFDK